MQQSINYYHSVTLILLMLSFIFSGTMLSLSVERNLSKFLLSFVYMCINVGDSAMTRRKGNISRFNPVTYLCLSLTIPWISSAICGGFFLCSVSGGERSLLVLLILVQLFPLLNFLLINTKVGLITKKSIYYLHFYHNIT